MSDSSNVQPVTNRLKLDGLFVQYGCGLSAPDGWVNFDGSPTLRLQTIPIVAKLLTRGQTVFPKSVRYGDVVKGLPIKTGSCAGVYASHVLEHLALEDFNRALSETHRILREGGHFRLIVPDLQQLARDYLEALSGGVVEASHNFMKNSYLGRSSRPKTMKDKLVAGFGNSYHLWMWDELSMRCALSRAGFNSIRMASFRDSDQSAFQLVENIERFQNAIAFEAIK